MTKPTLDSVAEEYLAWAAETFDPMDKRPMVSRFHGALGHSIREVGEIALKPSDLSEYTDAIGLILQAARLQGYTVEQLAAAWAEKLIVLRRREWRITPLGSIEHVRPLADCRCARCIDERGDTIEFQGLAMPASGMTMVLCQICGNKRCPKASDHRHACTGSNETGQPGSAYE